MLKKSYFLIFACLFVFGLASCGNEEVVNSPLIGTKWIESKMVSENCDDPELNEIDDTGCSDGFCQNLTFTQSTIIHEFVENGQATVDDGPGLPYESDGTYIYADGEKFKYKIEGDKLTIYFDSKSEGDACDEYVVFVAEN
ncbi:hypothetical protein [Marinigracilibium pacificum]|uniref:Lipocalin-like protein n=1 Tax=Marinigracilibium pacificum TaxID=2729599 RepID=A0A848J7L8_9BACT|nr:hypothetical protein [Marinigracilibium pacificum]NMM50480.1 hypothetical protein [Marinigracilibium pacificum]